MEYLSLFYVWNENSLIFCKLPILFWTVKLKLGHKFSLFIHRFKIKIFECWSLAILPSFSQFKNRFCDFWTFQFFPIHEKDGKLGFMNISECCTSIFSQFTRVGKLELLNFPWFHILLNCKDSLSGAVYL